MVWRGTWLQGTIQRSKFDAELPKIKELLGYGLSVRKLAKVLGCNDHVALNTYIKKRGIKESIPLNKNNALSVRTS